MREPHELPYAACRDLLATGLVGRVGVCTPSGPRIFPVNHAVIGESIVFRTTPHSVLGTYAWNSALAFEVDHLDYEYQRGWSVLATGRGASVEDPDELAAIRAAWEPRPWAGGERRLYVRLTWDELTGRQLGLGWTPMYGLPAHRTL